MVKLYKVIVLFVGLIAMNISVQAQSAPFYPYFSAETTIGTNALVANYYASVIATENTENNDWAGISSLYTAKEVTNFTNYPNPAITSTTIAYTLSAKTMVNLRVIDLTGKQLALLVKQEQNAGKQEYFWELSRYNITSGMYILILQVDNKVFSRKMIVQ